MTQKHQVIRPPDSTPTISFLDTSIPNMTRILDYLSGGSAYFEIDRIVAKQMTAVMPSFPNWIRLRRAFLSEAAPILKEEGFEQFLDFGSGMPSEDLIHSFVEDVAIVYSDINIVAISYGNNYFSEMPLVEYIYGQVKELDDIFAHPTVQQLINLESKVALGLNLMPMVFLPDEMKKMAQELYDWAPAGSRLFFVVQSRAENDLPESYSNFTHAALKTGLPFQLYTLQQNLDMLAPWKPLLLEPLTDFLGLPNDYAIGTEEDDISLTFHAAFFVK